MKRAFIVLVSMACAIFSHAEHKVYEFGSDEEAVKYLKEFAEKYPTGERLMGEKAEIRYEVMMKAEGALHRMLKKETGKDLFFCQ